MLFETHTLSYRTLPDSFYTRVAPQPVDKPQWIAFNHMLADNLSLDRERWCGDEGLNIFSGNAELLHESSIACAYAGHQFGNFVPSLGDGRAVLIGEFLQSDKTLADVQLKGSGRTSYSRNGDGRAGLGPVIREYVMSEAMHALGIPTTRALAALTTGQPIMRETMQHGAILVRVAAGHVRVGTFEYFAAREDYGALKALADYVIARYYPECRSLDAPHTALLCAIAEKQAKLIASWCAFGFIHGVMNTDNMSVTGETIDYGPCAFMDYYDPAQVYSFIDKGGRYAFGNQPSIGQWNIAALAEAMTSLLEDEEGGEAQQQALQTYNDAFNAAWVRNMHNKFGFSAITDTSSELIKSSLLILEQHSLDYTNFFIWLMQSCQEKISSQTEIYALNNDLLAWQSNWRALLRSQDVSSDAALAKMRRVNPHYIPRNHQLAAIIAEAEENLNYGAMHKLLSVLSTPYHEKPGMEAYMAPPTQSEQVVYTYCGT